MDITINVKLEGPGIERAITLLAEAIGWQTWPQSGDRKPPQSCTRLRCCF